MQTTKHSQLVVLHALYVTSGRVTLAEAYLRGGLEGKLHCAPTWLLLIGTRKRRSLDSRGG